YTLNNHLTHMSNNPFTNIVHTIIFSCTATPPTERYTLSLHDALPICTGAGAADQGRQDDAEHLSVLFGRVRDRTERTDARRRLGDRKSTRLNSSHVKISYAVFCLKKKKRYRLYKLHDTHLMHIPEQKY